MDSPQAKLTLTGIKHSAKILQNEPLKLIIRGISRNQGEPGMKKPAKYRGSSPWHLVVLVSLPLGQRSHHFELTLDAALRLTLT